MKLTGFMLALCLLAALIPAAFSQESVIRMENEALAPHQRPIISFDHDRHSAVIQCQQCHHVFDQFRNNQVSDEGQKCSTCHGQPGKDILPLMEAFHTQCKSCHQTLHDTGRPSGPVMCGECHVRK
jgi:hypothetical protein